MERSVRSSPYTTVTVRTLAVHGVLERLGHNTVLHREIRVAVTAHALIHGPGAAEVIQHNTRTVVHRHSITLRIAHITQTHTNKTHNDVARIDNKRIVRNTDSVTRSGLSVNSDIACFDAQFPIQMNRTRDGKNHTSRTCLVHGIP